MQTLDRLGEVLRAAESWEPFEIEDARAHVVEVVCDVPRSPLRIGRYVVLERIGRGTNGIVYSAYDPDLHRRVAVKVLRPRNQQMPGATELLLREARAIARLSHPNVVAVHDVGTTGTAHDRLAPGVFIVMELVDGAGLDEWLEERRRRWRDVLDTLVPIGKALLAAHRRGLVHRDVKPANVLLGSDGRARLADFGLVSLASASTEASTSLGATDPFHGTAVGTPATMAPEQHLGRPADARTDQYGYCATLHMALHGRLPFAATGLDALLAAKRTQRPIGAAPDVPAWLDDVIARGLAPDPARRFSDMAELVAALERGRGRRRRRASVGLAAIAVGCIGMLAIRSAEPSAAERCRVAGDQAMAAAWTHETRAAVRAGMRATGAPRAEGAVAAVESTIDARVDEWHGVREQVCDAMGDDGDVVSAAKVACLDAIVVEVDELAQLLGAADRDVVHGVPTAVRYLTSASECLAPGTDVDARELDVTLRRARLHEAAGRTGSAAVLAEQALADARARGDATAEARALAVGCRLALLRSGRREAEPTCEAALLSAERAGHDELTTAGLIRMVEAMDGHGDAARLYRLAEARLAGRPHAVATLRVDLMFARARVHQSHDRLGPAGDAARAALAYAEESFEPDSPELVEALNLVAVLDYRTGRLAAAGAAYRRAIDITARTRGADDADMGPLSNNLAGLELERGEPAAALGLLVTALAIKTAIGGSESPRLVNTLGRIAQAWHALGEHEAALAVAHRAVAIAAREGEADPRLLGHAELVLAGVQRGADRCEDAFATLEHAERHLARAGAGDDDLGDAREIRGTCRAVVHDGRAREDLEEAVAALGRFYGPGARDLVPSLIALARWHADRGDDARALPLLARARSICTQTEGDPADVRAVESTFAEILVRQTRRKPSQTLAGTRPT
jgi:eukaryotic-like serine/threonine-protein kinase